MAGGGTVTLEGGTIRNGYLAISNADAYGAGVFVGPGGTFLMKSGEITGNTARTTVSSYRTYGGGAAVMAGGTFVMTGGKISGNEAETGGGGFYIQNGASVTLNAASSGSGLQITGNFLRKNGVQEQNNLYFAEDATAFLSGSMAGAEVGSPARMTITAESSLNLPERTRSALPMKRLFSMTAEPMISGWIPLRQMREI